MWLFWCTMWFPPSSSFGTQTTGHGGLNEKLGVSLGVRLCGAFPQRTTVVGKYTILKKDSVKRWECHQESCGAAMHILLDFSISPPFLLDFTWQLGNVCSMRFKLAHNRIFFYFVVVKHIGTEKDRKKKESCRQRLGLNQGPRDWYSHALPLHHAEL